MYYADKNGKIIASFQAEEKLHKMLKQIGVSDYTVTTEQPKHEKTLDEIKKNKIDMLKRQRDRLEVSPINWNGNNFDYDNKARARLAIARQAIEDGLVDSLVWTTADHENVTVTLDDFKGINANASIRSNLLHVAYRNAKQAVIDAEKIETVKAVKLEA